MANLTDEQIERAQKAFMNSQEPEKFHCMLVDVAVGLRAAAPFLQIPWENATDYEAKSFWGGIDAFLKKSTCESSLRETINEFISWRNKRLLPKPDPREDAIIGAMQGNGNILLGHDLRPVAKKIIAALDEVKP